MKYLTDPTQLNTPKTSEANNSTSMVEYHLSSQYNIWKFDNAEEIEACRMYTNLQARKFLHERESNADTPPAPITVSCYACNKQERQAALQQNYNAGPWESPSGHKYITPAQEKMLVFFYLTKLPTLVGPMAHNRRLRVNSKVVATAAILYQRFYLSNSVLLFDPKVMFVAAVFLASKAEDQTLPIKLLEEGSKDMNSPVLTDEIVPAEVQLVAGVHFDLQCFHSYQPQIDLMKGVQNYLKKKEPSSSSAIDFKTVYDTARRNLDAAIIETDIALYNTPSHIALASLWKASTAIAESAGSRRIDWAGYLEWKFPQNNTDELIQTKIPIIIRQLSVNYEDNVAAVKTVHKQLKKVRGWGDTTSGKKKKKKRNAEGDPDAVGSSSKRVKVEEKDQSAVGEPDAVGSSSKRVKVEEKDQSAMGEPDAVGSSSTRVKVEK